LPAIPLTLRSSSYDLYTVPSHRGVLANVVRVARVFYDGPVVDNRGMPTKRDSSKVLGPLEADVMNALWKARQPLTVRAVLDLVNHRREHPLAYTTVMTVLTRLAEKGIVNRHSQGRGFVYQAAVGDAAGIAVREVLRDFGDAAVAQFIDEARADPKLLRRLERLLKEER
jgi:predicted transcriptional regulator